MLIYLQKRRALSSPHGFTLLEVLVAIVILSIGLMGTAGLTTGIIRSNHFSKNLTSATAAAQTQLESIKSGGYSKAVDSDYPDDTVIMGGMTFYRSTEITPNTPAANMRTAVVTVNWTEANNTSRSVTLQTILAE
jgi:prepilin-type N-terminal cleavage/methylation domain-containing protein